MPQVVEFRNASLCYHNFFNKVKFYFNFRVVLICCYLRYNFKFKFKNKGYLMKKGIHPEYIPCKVTCVTSGKEIEVLSTKPEMRIDISSFCHPFYTGSDKIADTAGRVEKFKQRYNLK